MYVGCINKMVVAEHLFFEGRWFNGKSIPKVLETVELVEAAYRVGGTPRLCLGGCHHGSQYLDHWYYGSMSNTMMCSSWQQRT
jgi:uncharacterized protein YodC (DUF2158 family)